MADIRDYELSLIGFLVREPGLLVNSADSMREFHFEYPNAPALFTIVAGHVRRHGRAPSLPEMEYLLRHVSAASNWELVRLDQALEDARTAWEIDVSPASGEILHDFVQTRELQAIARDLTSKPAKEVMGNLRLVKDRLDKLSQDKRDLEDIGISLFSREGMERGTAAVAQVHEGDPVPTGWPGLDELLLGGLRPEEVTVIMAVTGKGKTLALINIAAHIVSTGRRVIYYALDNPIYEMAERMYACCCRIPISKDLDLEQYRRDVFTGIGGAYHDLFWVKSWPPNRKRVVDMKIHAERIKEICYRKDLEAGVPEDKAGHIDAIISDYGDLFLAGQKREAFRMELGDVFLEHVAVSRELSVPVLTATQGNRQALSLPYINMEHVGESLAKLQPVANVIGIGQSKEEKARNEAHADILKGRRPEAEGMRIHLSVNKRLQMMCENPERPPTPIEGWEDADEMAEEQAKPNRGGARPAPFSRTRGNDADLANLPQIIGALGSEWEPPSPSAPYEG